MSLRTKILIAVAIVLIGSMALYFSIFRLVVFQSFLELEQEEARRDMHRCISALDRDVEHLAQFVHDWAAWDDTYHYVQDHNKAYEESNLVFDSFSGRQLNLIHLYDKNGALIWGKIYDLSTKKEINLKDFPPTGLPPDNPLLVHPTFPSHHSGILLTEKGPMIISSNAIITSDLKGPVVGSIVMGFFLDQAYVQTLSRQVRVNFNITTIDKAKQNEFTDDIVETITPQAPIRLIEKSDERLNAYALVNDISGKPALLFEAGISRQISKKGIQALDLASLFTTGVGIILLITILLLLHWLFVRPVTNLTQTILAIGKSGDLTANIKLHRKDEIGTLAQEFDTMIHQLAQARKKLMDQSYQAGMARQATDVLHNVGNVLNTVNISTDLLAEKIQVSSARQLQKAVDLLEENSENLAEFLLSDSKGQLLPEFLKRLSEQIGHEHQDWQTLVASLKKNIDHIKQIVNMQQNYATTTGVNVSISPKEIFEDAVVISEAGLGRHKIELIREYQDIDNLFVDKQKVLQILINLISNAKYSISNFCGGKRQLTLRLTKPTDDTVQFDVIDTGEGIEAKNLEKLFVHGFTTKKKGHGFGLHSSANAAKELGGSLSAHSDGPGKGATFSLVVPVNSK